MPDPRIEVIGAGLPPVTDFQFSLMLDFIEVAVAENGGPLWVADCLSQPSCGVFLKDGTDVPCLCAYQEEATGSWVVLTRDNRIIQFLASEVL